MLEVSAGAYVVLQIHTGVGERTCGSQMRAVNWIRAVGIVVEEARRCGRGLSGEARSAVGELTFVL